MSIPSIDQVSGAFNVVGQSLKYVFDLIPSAYRTFSGWHQINKIYEDPNMSTTKKTASILLAGINMSTESQILAHKVSILPRENLQQLASIAILTRGGMDALHAFENPNIWDWEIAVSGAKYTLKMQQIAHNREELNTAVNIMETAEILYTHRKIALSALKKLHRKISYTSQITRNALQTRSAMNSQQTNIPTEIVQNAQEATNSQSMNAQKFYQDLLERYKKTLQGECSDFEILNLLNQHIHELLQTVRSKLRECKTIIDEEDITHFDTIPFLLHGEAVFQKRMCRISGKPIRKVVVVRSSNNSKPIYYEWKNLQHALEDGICPPRWPASLPFGPESTIIDIEETREVVNELKKASSNPQFKKDAQEKYLDYKMQKKALEEALKLLKVDLAQAKA